jgi:hypothetical protein
MRRAIIILAAIMLFAGIATLMTNYFFFLPLELPMGTIYQHIIHRQYLFNHQSFQVRASTLEEAALVFLVIRNHSPNNSTIIYVGLYNNHDPSKEILDRLGNMNYKVKPISHSYIPEDRFLGRLDVQTQLKGNTCVLAEVEWRSKTEATIKGIYGSGGGYFIAKKQRWYWVFYPTGTEWCS